MCLIIQCPHCHATILIARRDLNCRIFRHGVYKSTGQGIPPHAPRDECERLVTQGLIYGCGKPFQIDEKECPVVCDYI